MRKHCLSESEYIIVQCSNKWTLSDLNSNILKRAGFEITQSTKTATSGKAKILASIKAKFGLGEGSGGFEIENTDTTEKVTQELELDSDDVNDIISALKSIEFKKYIVLEDFHYLRTDIQRDFAIELKAFHENSPLCFIVIGVWLDENRLVMYNGDLTGRLIQINADKWEKEELKQVIKNGEQLLNIKFDDTFVEELVSNSFENVYIVQEACYQICVDAKIRETQSNIINVGGGIDTRELVKRIINIQSARYNAFILHYAAGFQTTSLEMHKWILYPIIISQVSELSKGLTYHRIKECIQSKHPRGAELNSGNLTQALQSSASLQLSKNILPIIIDYDETNLKLHIVDKGFLIWLEYQNRDELFEMAELKIG